MTETTPHALRPVDARMGQLAAQMHRSAAAVPPGACPLEVQLAALQVARSQSCGKCTPCRLGLMQLETMLKSLVEGRGDSSTIADMRALAATVVDSADCAVGYVAAEALLFAMDAFADEFAAHAAMGSCTCAQGQKIPCMELCPAHVDIPGYIALAGAGRCAEAINLIRRDNPLPTACAMICEHPCEQRCRRQLIDAPLNIRGLKKFAVDQVPADHVEVPAALPATGKRVAIIGGGPAGLAAAYFLALMGHAVSLYERQEKLGGMLRYGIPNYRFPKERLDEDIHAILSAGAIEVHAGAWVESAQDIQAISQAHDALFVAIGAQGGKLLRLENADACGVSSAVAMLDEIGCGRLPDYAGKNVVVIGGGNVAMDAARSAVRLGAQSVSVVYRRRKEDMTALETEIEAAVAEGVELMTLAAPKAIVADESGACAGLTVQPQMIGAFDAAGRPAPRDAAKPPLTIACDVVLIAVGQGIASEPFVAFGMPESRGALVSASDTSVAGMPGVFSGGDCATGPATAIRAIAAGKAAAFAIDRYLGFSHELDCGAAAPAPTPNNRVPMGRANITERAAHERKRDFNHVENKLTAEEAVQEAGRCLRCDCYGFGCVEGGAQ